MPGSKKFILKSEQSHSFRSGTRAGIREKVQEPCKNQVPGHVFRQWWVVDVFWSPFEARPSCELWPLSWDPGEVPPSLWVLSDEGLSLGEAVGPDITWWTEGHSENQVCSRLDVSWRPSWFCWAADRCPLFIHHGTWRQDGGEQHSFTRWTGVDFVLWCDSAGWSPVSRRFCLHLDCGGAGFWSPWGPAKDWFFGWTIEGVSCVVGFNRTCGSFKRSSQSRYSEVRTWSWSQGWLGRTVCQCSTWVWNRRRIKWRTKPGIQGRFWGWGFNKTVKTASTWGVRVVIGGINGVTVLQPQRSKNPEVQVWLWSGGLGAEFSSEISTDSLADLLGGWELMVAVLERSIIYVCQVPLQVLFSVIWESLSGQQEHRTQTSLSFVSWDHLNVPSWFCWKYLCLFFQVPHKGGAEEFFQFLVLFL